MNKEYKIKEKYITATPGKPSNFGCFTVRIKEQGWNWVGFHTTSILGIIKVSDEFKIIRKDSDSVFSQIYTANDANMFEPGIMGDNSIELA